MAVFNETQAQRAIAQFFDWTEKKVFINAYLFSWEMDVCVITDSGYVWEIEIKTSLADWRADATKDKWKSKDIQKISRFYYAVPWTLLKSIPEHVPEHVGIIALHVAADGKTLVAKPFRDSKSKRGYTLTDQKYRQLFNSVYHRYWRQISPMEEKEDQSCYIDLPEDVQQLLPDSAQWRQHPSSTSPPSTPKPEPKSMPKTSSVSLTSQKSTVPYKKPAPPLRLNTLSFDWSKK